MRSSTRPSRSRAARHTSIAFTTWPRCRYPVGAGANLVIRALDTCRGTWRCALGDAGAAGLPRRGLQLLRDLLGLLHHAEQVAAPELGNLLLRVPTADELD